ncbi:uncharacterized protein LOC124944671 [Impatiens glandulifera]|uniref:uncharacterized protein LOC124944671 n=1 Tax=Impatiens glandulifera TaxID=253017 RepID=UPI001FB18FF5|nr:uncharacterized protein LOC124944671 [Impatiens glandulifera]
MLEDQVAYLLQRYLGNYVKGLNKEALKISVWQGDVELNNMQLKPEALNALKLPVKVKAGFLGSLKLKVPWSRLGQEPVVVSLDRIFLLAEPATQVEGSSDDAVQEVRKSRIRETEMKLLETRQQITSEMNKSWLGSLIDTIIGNLKLSITNIHIRYEDCESTPGHPFAAGITLEKLSAVTVDDNGKETFITGGALEHILKSVELEQLAVYLDSDSSPWHLDKPWEDLKPIEWGQVLKFGTTSGQPAHSLITNHNYLLQPVTGNAKYTKLRKNESTNIGQPLQKVSVNLDDVTFCLSKSGYRDLLRLADNFAAFNQRFKYAHFRPLVRVKEDPQSWWRYAYRVVSDELKKASGKLSWEHVLKYARLRKRYISLYASLLKSDLCRTTIDDNKEIEELDRILDFELILQWRMLAHKFVEQSVESKLYLKRQNEKTSWSLFKWGGQSNKDDGELGVLGDDDWEQINKLIGYKESDDGQLITTETRGDVLHTSLEIHMRHNASKLTDDQECIAELSCKNLDCFVKLYPEAKVFDVKLGSYQLSSPNGLLAESGTAYDSLVGVFHYKPFNSELDWSMIAKASPCYITYLKEAIDRIISFFESTTAVSQAVALETAAVVQMTIDEVKRTAQQQVNRALKDHTRFLLDLDIAAPKITIPSDFCPDNVHSTKLLLDLGNLIIRSQGDNDFESPDEMNLYLQFFMILTDVSAFLVDGDYNWTNKSHKKSAKSANLGPSSYLPVIDKCGVVLKLQQIRLENPSYPSTKLAIRVPSLGFHFSPASYHRLMHVGKIFQQEESDNAELVHPWSSADFEGWLSLLTWKGVGNREAVWQRRYVCLVGPFLYVLENPDSRSYKQYLSLRGKQVFQVPVEMVDSVDHVLAVFESSRPTSKVIEDGNALILRCDSNDTKRTWLSRLQGAIYRASGSAPITSLSGSSSDQESPETEQFEKHDSLDTLMEKIFLTGVLDELKICFKYNPSQDQKLTNILLAEEGNLFEFRATGGQVELSIRGNDMFIGTILKSLEIEDLVCCKGMSQSCYLARSFIGNADAALGYYDAEETQGFDSSLNQDDEDRFYEAPEDLNDSDDSLSGNMRSQSSLLSEKSLLQPPSFFRIDGLLPSGAAQNGNTMEATNTLDSFVKAQIVIIDHNSILFRNIDKQVSVTLATLTFFCRRPTILAILKFVDAINIQDESDESFTKNSSAVITQNDTSIEDVLHTQQAPVAFDEPVVKGLLGKGKSRIMFYLMLNMTRAQILLMNENDTKLATLSQDNLLTDIKVFPSSFSIKASLGNLRISDDSLLNDHMYFWVCDMRNPGGSSFVELDFSSFSVGDEDYAGYEYSLLGGLSEVRIVYLNRFVQEVVGYFMGLVPNNSRDVVRLRDQATNSEKWFTTSEIEGSPAMKLDLSLRKPIILMPRSTDSHEYLKLDVVHITVQNAFRWYGGNKEEINAVHVEMLSIMVEDINLNVGTGDELGESIIQDVKGVSIIIHRSLRDLSHQIPNIEVQIKIVELNAALSNKEYQIITECALSNISETPKIVPPLIQDSGTPSVVTEDPPFSQDFEATNSENQNSASWITMKVCIDIDLVELRLHYGIASDASLATVQVSGGWFLYKTNTIGDGFLSASLKGFTVIDDREGTEQALRLAIRKPESIGYSSSDYETDNKNHPVDAAHIQENEGTKPVPTMLILDAKFSQYSTFVSLCVQRPQLLVALDFLLAVVEFFVPTVRSLLSNEEGENDVDFLDAIILEQSIYCQPSSELFLSPRRPLVADDESFDTFVYDGRGGTLYLQNEWGSILSSPSSEAVIYVGNGKRLQFKNVTIKNGQYLDSCILLGANSSYSALKDDKVYFESVQYPQSNSSAEASGSEPCKNPSTGRSTEFVFELQAIGPELTFYATSKEVGTTSLSNKLLHAQLDAFSRVVMKGETMEMNTNILGLTMESSGIRILEPFDASMKFSNISGKMNIHFSVSNIFMNFSFSILRLFIAVEDDILAFLRTTSRKMTILSSEFDKVGTIKNPNTDQIFTFWRPRAPPGFAVLGDYLTPLNKPPSKGVIAVNTSLVRVKRPVSFNQVWPPIDAAADPQFDMQNCSIWFPVAPKGYVALGCVVSTGMAQPPLSSSFCIMASLVAPCTLRDCITIKANNSYTLLTAFWRVDNSLGTFLPADPSTLGLIGRASELRHMYFFPSSRVAKRSESEAYNSGHIPPVQSEGPSNVNSGQRFEVVASFRLIWWNQNSNSGKKLSIWRPMVPPGMVYFGDIAVQGYEPPNSCIVLHDTEGDELLKPPLDFQLVGQIKKRRRTESISFWLPQAPPGFVSLGCIASKGMPEQSDLSLLRCVRSDMVTGDQFQEESIWDTSDKKSRGESFSIWTIDNEFGTFIVRTGFKKPHKRFALKLADPDMATSSDDIVIDAEIGTFSAALFDDYGGLMVPLFNISLSDIGFNLHGRSGSLTSFISFSLAARSYNDKYEVWEPLIEPVDGFLRYMYNQNAPGTPSQLRLTCPKDLNVNVSVSNCNMFFQAYASWSNLAQVHDALKDRETSSPTYPGRSFLDVHHKHDYYLIPQNNLGQDIFIRATEIRGISNVVKMPSGDMKPIKVPVWKNMLDSHLKGNLCKKSRTVVAIIISEAEIPRIGGFSSHLYTVAVRVSPEQVIAGEFLRNPQSARTCGIRAAHNSNSDYEMVKWNEMLFFRVDTLEGYMVELVVTDTAKGDPVGYFSASLKHMAETFLGELTWLELSPVESAQNGQVENPQNSYTRISCAVLLSPAHEMEIREYSAHLDNKSGYIQISPSKEGPWTTVRLNYAAPAACWRLGNNVVASEVNVKDGNRYVSIRSLVSVRNNTDFTLDLCLKHRALDDGSEELDTTIDLQERNITGRFETDVLFETEKYDPSIGWVDCNVQPNIDHTAVGGFHQGMSRFELPSGWDWVDDWHLDKTTIAVDDGWVYAPDFDSLKWPETFSSKDSKNFARQRKWIRNRKWTSVGTRQDTFVGPLKPGESLPLPLSSLTQNEMYILQLRPSNLDSMEFSWSNLADRPKNSDECNENKENSEICLSNLVETDELLFCSQIGETSSNTSRGIWFCLSIQATEIAKDIHSDPIQDWSLIVKSPLSITNYLPLSAEYSVLEMQSSGHFVACTRGVFPSGKTVKIHTADIRKPLYFSLLPQRGWLPIHDAVLLSHPRREPSKSINLRSSISGRVVQIILEQNNNKERPPLAKIIRVYTPYWITVARCPLLTFRLLELATKREARKSTFAFKSRKKNEVLVEEITDEELYLGCSIASALNFKSLGLSVSISPSGGDSFGPIKDLSPLGDMDGSVDLYAYDVDGNCIHLFISSKPCPYQSIPTKVISVRPFITFTNRLGCQIFLKLNSEDEPKVLHAYDSRVSFVHHPSDGPNALQVKLENTEWSFPTKIFKEDTIFLMLRKADGGRTFLRIEIRGYEEGSRFIIVFRIGSENGPIRLENRTVSNLVSIRQSGFGDDAWVQLQPLSTINFTWEDPYGQKLIDAKVENGSITTFCSLHLDKAGISQMEGVSGMHFMVIEIDDIKIGRFTDVSLSESPSNEISRIISSVGNLGNSHTQSKSQDATPVEFIVELGIVGISLIDYKPKELLYLYLERVVLSYSTGYDGGMVNRFKLILGQLQLDNQLPLTLMPVLLAPEHAADVDHPVFKMTLTIHNESADGIQVYPYIYIRVTDRNWRLNIHEPIIWALVDFYNNLQLDRIPQSSNASQVDPEIRIDLIDVSEVRVKVCLETEPTLRPPGVLGVWSPILSAVGNAFKVQVHLRKVMHRDRFMRKSSVLPAIGNRIWRDLIHNPLHLIFSVDVLGMTSSTLASLSKGFARLSTDGQFLQLRSKQVWSRRITGVSDGIKQGTEALAQGVAFGVTGVVTKPVESARQSGLIGFAHGLGRAFLGIIVQPVSGALDFFSLTVDGIGASCTRCLEVLSNRTTLQRIRNPRAVHIDNVIREYNEREAVGQMILYLAEASRHFGCTDIFKEPSKFAWSDYYEDHFSVPYQRIVLVTNKRVMLLQCLAPEKMDRKPCKILWDVPWEELLSVELAKAGGSTPSHLILHIKNFRRSQVFVRVIKCGLEEDSLQAEPQAVRICLAVRKMWKTHQSNMRSLTLKVPSSQRNVCFAWSDAEGANSHRTMKPMLKSRKMSSSSPLPDERRFVKRSINFSKVWSSELDSKGRCTLCKKKAQEGSRVFSIWRPACPDGYVSIGDIAHVGRHPPNVAAVYRISDQLFAPPMGYDLVWRNCAEDYVNKVSIWYPRAPEGFVSLGCVAVDGYEEPEGDLVYCISESVVEETTFEDQKIWSCPNSYPWACHIYQVKSDALHFAALRQPREYSEWIPKRVLDQLHLADQSSFDPSTS